MEEFLKQYLKDMIVTYIIPTAAEGKGPHVSALKSYDSDTEANSSFAVVSLTVKASYITKKANTSIDAFEAAMIANRNKINDDNDVKFEFKSYRNDGIAGNENIIEVLFKYEI